MRQNKALESSTLPESEYILRVFARNKDSLVSHIHPIARSLKFLVFTGKVTEAKNESPFQNSIALSPSLYNMT